VISVKSVFFMCPPKYGFGGRAEKVTSNKKDCVANKSLSQRERVARVSEPGEGYHYGTPHPPLRGTLSRWERDSLETLLFTALTTNPTDLFPKEFKFDPRRLA
jgi:hypothetical protein